MLPLYKTWMNALQQVLVGLFFCDDVTGTIYMYHLCAMCCMFYFSLKEVYQGAWSVKCCGHGERVVCQVLWTWGASGLSSVVDMGSEWSVKCCGHGERVVCQVLWTWGASGLSSVVDMGSEWSVKCCGHGERVVCQVLWT